MKLTISETFAFFAFVFDISIARASISPPMILHLHSRCASFASSMILLQTLALCIGSFSKAKEFGLRSPGAVLVAISAASMQIVPLPQNGSSNVGPSSVSSSNDDLSFLYQSLLYKSVDAINSDKTACVCAFLYPLCESLRPAKSTYQLTRLRFTCK